MKFGPLTSRSPKTRAERRLEGTDHSQSGSPEFKNLNPGFGIRDVKIVRASCFLVEIKYRFHKDFSILGMGVEPVNAKRKALLASFLPSFLQILFDFRFVYRYFIHPRAAVVTYEVSGARTR